MEEARSVEADRWTWVRTRLPWMVAAAFFVLYLTTLCRWVRLESLWWVARVGGWEVSPWYWSPLQQLVGWPFGLAGGPGRWMALNGVMALCGAVSLGLLARIVAIWPHDRRKEERLRELGESSVLHGPWSWLPPLAAAAICGLQSVWWSHSTVASGEALDVLIFAVIVWCLAEYRHSGEGDKWFWMAGFAYGLGVANNYGMLGWAPVFFVSVVWVRGWEVWRGAFVLRMMSFFLTGLLLYLWLPLLGMISGTWTGGFWDQLRVELKFQKVAITSFPRFVPLLLSFTSVLPLILAGARFGRGDGETSAAGERLGRGIAILVYGALLAGAASVMVDPKWGPKSLGGGQALLSFYFLSAVAAGYYLGYFVLMMRQWGRRGWDRNRGAGAREASVVTLVLACVAFAGYEAYRNAPLIWAQRGHRLTKLAEAWVSELPASGGTIIADDNTDLLLIGAGLERAGILDKYVLMNSKWIENRIFHDLLTRRYGARWVKLPDIESMSDPYDGSVLAPWMVSIARSRPLFYAHASFGYYFEVLRDEPAGMMLHMVPRTSSEPVGALPAEILSRNEAFWAKNRDWIQGLSKYGEQTVDFEARYLAGLTARAMNASAVAFQRSGKLAEAKNILTLASSIAPWNETSKRTLEANTKLSSGGYTAVPTLDAAEESRRWDEWILAEGFVDEPKACFRLGQIFSRGLLYRQALLAYDRAARMIPAWQAPAVWAGNMRVLSMLGDTDTKGAEDYAVRLCGQYPKEESVWETLGQVYMATGRLTNFLEVVAKQLVLNPNQPRALLNQAAVNIQLGRFAAALPPLDALLKIDPENNAAMMNRAIAQLQLGRYDAALRDYEWLRSVAPNDYRIYFGLGEANRRKGDKPKALEYFDEYLRLASMEHGRTNSAEYKAVAQNVKELRK